ncbi:MAG: hypothetical protein KAT58_02990, partial [candidate division Zixibacteria bacterium]|nr:hypothetical protein [candidate division Zixibacteria bacterium]
SLSAYHDLKRVADLARHFRLPVGICLNKSDINARIAGEIETYARNNNMDFLGALPYDALFTRAQVAGKTLIEYTSNQTTDRIRSLWVRLQEKLELGNKDSLPADQKKR